MLEKAFGCELAHHIRHLASLSLISPFYRMPLASTGAPVMMFADAVAVVAVDEAVKSSHFGVAVEIAAVKIGVTSKIMRYSLKFINYFIFVLISLKLGLLQIQTSTPIIL